MHRRRVAAACLLMAMVALASPCTVRPAQAFPGEALFTRVTYMARSLFSSGARFVESPAEAVKEILHNNFRKQDLAIDAIIGAVSLWAHEREMGEEKPLVLAFSGTTGVGKTSSAEMLARGLLTKQDGFLELRGEDYADPSVSFSVYGNDIKAQVVDHIQANPHAAVIVIEEAQKARSKVLDVLRPALSSAKSHLSHTVRGHRLTVSCHNVVFIIISDIGMEKVVEHMVRGVVDRDSDADIASAVASHIRLSLHSHWEGLGIGGLIHHAVAFLPLGPPELLPILAMRLHNLGEQYRGVFWSQFTFDDALLEMLTDVPYITFETFKSSSGHTKKLSKYGAREVHEHHTGPIKSLKKVLVRELSKPRKPDCYVHVGVDDNRNMFIRRCEAGADTGADQDTCAVIFAGIP